MAAKELDAAMGDVEGGGFNEALLGGVRRASYQIC
jgi:hypothetical protein